MFLGIPDFAVLTAYLLCIISTLGCVVYGLINWNKEGDDELQQADKGIKNS